MAEFSLFDALSMFRQDVVNRAVGGEWPADDRNPHPGSEERFVFEREAKDMLEVSQRTEKTKLDEDKEEAFSEIPSVDKVKVFVGGLAMSTESSDLEALSIFGPLASAEVMYNRSSGVSRGFGFVVFKEHEGAEAAAAAKHVTINEKTCELKYAVKRGDVIVETFQEKIEKQVFVGGLPQDATADELRRWASEHFESESLKESLTVTSAIVVLDLQTKRPRGFGFVSFATKEMVIKVLEMVPSGEMKFREGCPDVQVKRALKEKGRKQEGAKAGKKAGGIPKQQRRRGRRRGADPVMMCPGDLPMAGMNGFGYDMNGHTMYPPSYGYPTVMYPNSTDEAPLYLGHAPQGMVHMPMMPPQRGVRSSYAMRYRP